MTEQEPATADTRIEGVLADLEVLAELPVEEHVRVYEVVHARLREILFGPDQDDLPPPPA